MVSENCTLFAPLKLCFYFLYKQNKKWIMRLNAAYLHLQRHCTFSMYARSLDRHDCVRACVFGLLYCAFSAMLLSPFFFFAGPIELVWFWFTVPSRAQIYTENSKQKGKKPWLDDHASLKIKWTIQNSSSSVCPFFAERRFLGLPKHGHC